MNSSILQREYLGNSVENFLWFAGILMAGWIFKRLLSFLLSRILFFVFRKHGRSIGWERFILLTNRPFQMLLMLILVYVAATRLVYPPQWMGPNGDKGIVMLILQRGFYTLLTFAGVWVVIRVVDFVFLVSIARARETESRFDDQLLPFLKEGVKVLIAAIGFLALIAVAFQLDVVGLVTGLGIGGLAFALAAKETLENLLGSFTIFFDKPFTVGNIVRVGNVEGRVESIGFRSTRIRPFDNTLVTLPNKKMVDAELVNETEREKRKSSFTFSIALDTEPEKIEHVISRIRAALKQHDMIATAPLQVSFRNIASNSIEIYCSFFVNSAEMDDFLKVQEEVNFKILSILSDEKVKFPKEEPEGFKVNQGRPLNQL